MSVVKQQPGSRRRSWRLISGFLIASVGLACAVIELYFDFIVNARPNIARVIAALFGGLASAAAIVRVYQQQGVLVDELPVTASPPTPLYSHGQLQQQSSAPQRSRNESLAGSRSLYGLADMNRVATPDPEPKVDRFANDPLFQMDSPAKGVRCFALPKEGSSLFECQDSYAFDVKRGRFAMTDGVSNSFLPRPWARILARDFVQAQGDFANEPMFTQWLTLAGNAWQQWVRSSWLSGSDNPHDWQKQITMIGAQSTLIGCAFHQSKQRDALDVTAVAVGDADLFCFRKTDGQWKLLEAFPLGASEAFSAVPDTLSTLVYPELTTVAWKALRHHRFTARRGDQLVLATDSLAKWILSFPTEAARHLLAIETTEQFEQLVQHERQARRLEDDDTSMLIVSVLP